MPAAGAPSTLSAPLAAGLSLAAPALPRSRAERARRLLADPVTVALVASAAFALLALLTADWGGGSGGGGGAAREHFARLGLGPCAAGAAGELLRVQGGATGEVVFVASHAAVANVAAAGFSLGTLIIFAGRTY